MIFVMSQHTIMQLYRQTDKTNLRNELAANKKVIEELNSKVQILDKKLRTSEQQRRDMTVAPNNDLQELELTRSILEQREAELAAKREASSQLSY
jgi:hypothetical protein